MEQWTLVNVLSVTFFAVLMAALLYISLIVFTLMLFTFSMIQMVRRWHRRSPSARD